MNELNSRDFTVMTLVLLQRLNHIGSASEDTWLFDRQLELKELRARYLSSRKRRVVSMRLVDKYKHVDLGQNSFDHDQQDCELGQVSGGTHIENNSFACPRPNPTTQPCGPGFFFLIFLCF